MTDLRKAAEMALLTLEGWSNHNEWVWPESALDQAKRNTKEAIEALRQALAQPEQDEGVDGSVRIYIKRNGTFERVDTVEKALELSREMHTAPPKQWVGLTEEEREQATGWSVEHIEAALRSKNNG